jgi:hypothetical protein
VVAKVRGRLAVSKQLMHRFHMERFNLKKLKKIEANSSTVLKSQICAQLWKT